jgi:hypothetical protein
MHHVQGNVFHDSAPPAFFREWLAGPLFRWADTPEKNAAANAWALLATDGARTGVEVKLSRQRASDSQGDRQEAAGITTLGIVVHGHMQIDLIERERKTVCVFDLNTEGAFLGWHSSFYTHRWRALSDSTIVTVRWSEHAACTREP